MYILSNISNLILVVANIRIKVHKWNFIRDNLVGGQFICRETCCFVHLARKNILQPKEKMAGAICRGEAISFLPYFDFTLMDVYRNAGIK